MYDCNYFVNQDDVRVGTGVARVVRGGARRRPGVRPEHADATSPRARGCGRRVRHLPRPSIRPGL